ncbi:MAG: hypothetical protein ACSLE5_11680 [Porticoccaceae bacterium]
MKRYVVMEISDGKVKGVFDDFEVALAVIFTQRGAYERKAIEKLSEGNWVVTTHGLRIVRITKNTLY